MTKPSRKQRLFVSLDPSVMNRLMEHAARRDHSRSLVTEAAIESFLSLSLSPNAAERQEAAITKRLDQLDRRMTRLDVMSASRLKAPRCSSSFGLRPHPPCRNRLHRLTVPRPVSATIGSSRGSGGASPKGRS